VTNTANAGGQGGDLRGREKLRELSGRGGKGTGNRLTAKGAREQELGYGVSCNGKRLRGAPEAIN